MATLLVSASTGAMGSIMQKLGTLLSDEYKLLKNARDDINFLTKELDAMRAFLIEMANVEKPDEQTKLRVNAMREMSYEIDGNIDKFMMQVEGEPTSKSDGSKKILDKNRKKVTHGKIRIKIAKYIKDIKRQIKEVSERHGRYKSDESSRTRNENVDPRISAFYKEVSELVGIDGPRNELVKWLSNKEGELGHQTKVLSIVGCGGLGKTTLAKQVYDELGAKYECRAFVSISRSPNISNILSSILCQLRNTDDTHGGADPHTIVNQIRDFLKDRRYFIVIDDIWDIPTWGTLDCALFKNNCDSVIMTTTRIHDVAKSCCSQEDLVYKIQPLDVLESNKLFFKRIFGSEEKCPSNFKETADAILKKCGGLPLAINAISSLLATGKTKEEWDRVRSSIEFAKGKNSNIDAMDYILSLSYFDLPLHLRSCLLYLTLFPEDYKIERQRLILLWISEGFICGEDGKSLIESAEACFHELVNRSLVQPLNIGADGNAEHCRVHDIILSFLVVKATEENFCTLLSNPSKMGNRIHRLSLMGNEDQESVKQLDLSRARSFIAFSSEHFPSLVKAKGLRVLDLRDCTEVGNRHVKEIVKLFQLRYLNIYRTDICKLPIEIGDLVYLETLDARETELVELPKSFTRLQRLAHLFVEAGVIFPDGIGNMKKLQEIGTVDPLKQSLNFVEELGKLENLKKLGITWATAESSVTESSKEHLFFSSLRKLETCNLATIRMDLHLAEDDAGLTRHPFFPALRSIRDVHICCGQLSWISKWLVLLEDLKVLETSSREEAEQHDIEMIGRIPTLLKFSIWSFNPEPIIISSTGFQKLREAYFFVTNKLVIEVGAMPNLKIITLSFSVREFKSAVRGGGGYFFAIDHFSSLASLSVEICCHGATAADVEEAQGALKSMTDAHPNRPTLEMKRVCRDNMLQDDEDSDEDSDAMSQDDEDSDEIPQNDEDTDEMPQENQMICFPKQTERKRKRE